MSRLRAISRGFYFVQSGFIAEADSNKKLHDIQALPESYFLSATMEIKLADDSKNTRIRVF